MLQLTEADQLALLQVARNSVKFYLTGETPRLPEPPVGALTELQGTFVSIHKGRELRGCIGHVHPAGPLYRSVADCAVAAAVNDPRFMPLTAAELSSVEFEISVLSPLQRVNDIREVEVGRDGLFVSKNIFRGLLLPQVATACGWDRQRFLEETCGKAGLKPDDWSDGVTVHRFSALVFGEKQLHLIPTT